MYHSPLLKVYSLAQRLSLRHIVGVFAICSEMAIGIFEQ